MKMKPPSGPKKQTQFKPNTNPIAERVKLMQSVYLQRIMKKNADRGYEKTNPIQTQFKPKQSQFHLPQRGKTEIRYRFSEIRYLSSAFCLLSLATELLAIFIK